MKIPSRISSLAIRAVTESMDVNVMIHIAKEIIDGYNLYERTGFRESMVVPQRDAARQIVQDMIKSRRFLYFVSILIIMHTTGYKGRVYNIKHLKEIVAAIKKDLGYTYDADKKLFMEDPSFSLTKNWGALLEDFEYLIAFLRIDIVGNSQMVRKYDDKLIQASYTDLRKIVEKAVIKRNGRIWHWEGDGGLAAFFFGNRNLHATLTGMEVINELYVYNLLHRRLPEPLKIRAAVHSGPCQYTHDSEQLLKEDTIKDTVTIEAKYTNPDSMTISGEISMKLDSSLLTGLEKITGKGKSGLYSYSIKMEQ